MPWPSTYVEIGRVGPKWWRNEQGGTRQEAWHDCVLHMRQSMCSLPLSGTWHTPPSLPTARRKSQVEEKLRKRDWRVSDTSQSLLPALDIYIPTAPWWHFTLFLQPHTSPATHYLPTFSWETLQEESGRGAGSLSKQYPVHSRNVWWLTGTEGAAFTCLLWSNAQSLHCKFQPRHLILRP